MMRLRACLLGLLVGLNPAPALSEPIDYPHLDQRLAALAASSGMVGLSVGIIENGEITFLRGYGRVARGGEPVTADTVFRWASLSKGVAASLVARLAAHGELSLSDTVGRFTTSLRLPGRGEQVLTLDQLLSHRVGVVPNAYDTQLEDGIAPAQIRKSLGKLKVMCPIGDCHTYQNVAFDAITEIIESVTDLPYDETAKALLFEPLGMTQASVGLEGLKASLSWAQPHRHGNDDRLPEPSTVKAAYYRVPAAGGINGSVRDLALYTRAQMGLVPDVLSQAALDEMQAPRIYTPREQSAQSRRYGGQMRDARYALGWRVYKYGEAGHLVVGHRGAVEGYRSLILFDPKIDSGIVALWNSESRRPAGIQYEVMDMVYGLPARDWLELDETPPVATD